MSDTSNYPYAIDGYQQIPLLVEKVSLVKADNLNRLRSATINLENTLGIAPHYSDTYGEFENVDARLENSEEILDSIDLQYVTDRGNETTHSLEVQSGTAALPAYTFWEDVMTGMYRPSANHLGFSTLGLERLRIDEDGQVGVGKINPNFLLDVGGDVNIDGNLEVLGDIHAVGEITFDSGTGGRIKLGSGDDDRVEFFADVSSNIIPDQDNTYDLGSVIQQWRDLMVGRVVSRAELDIEAAGVLDMDGSSVSISSNVGGMSIVSAAGALMQSMAGNVSLSSANDIGLAAQNEISLTSAIGSMPLLAQAGDISLTTNVGQISVNSAALLDIDGGNVNINSNIGGVVIESATGTSLSTMAGNIELVSANDVEVAAQAGNITATTDSGQISLNSEGNVAIQSASGDIGLLSQSGSISVTTDIGSISLNSAGEAIIGANAETRLSGSKIVLAAAADEIKMSTASGSAVMRTDGNFGIGTYEPDNKLSVVGGNIEVFDDGSLGPETLTETDLATDTKWTAINDFDTSAGNIHYEEDGGGVSVVTQVEADFAAPGVGDRWYALTYDVQIITEFSNGNPSISIATSFASLANTELAGPDGIGPPETKTILFKSTSSPGNFAIVVNPGIAVGGEFTIDNLSLRMVDGGDVVVSGMMTGGGPNGVKVLSSGNVGVGTTSPNSTLSVNGSVSFPIVAYDSSMSPYTLDESHYTVLADASADPVGILLPDPADCEGRVYNIKKIDSSANAVGIRSYPFPPGSNIDDTLLKQITIQWVSITVQSSGTQWYLI